MPSRESYSIKNYWKYPRNNRGRNYNAFEHYHKKEQKKLRLKSIWYLIFKKFICGSIYERKMFWLDSVTSPFNRFIGCKITKHKWYYMDDEEKAFCTKCHKKTEHIPRDQWKRMKKLKSIKKRIK